MTQLNQTDTDRAERMSTSGRCMSETGRIMLLAIAGALLLLVAFLTSCFKTNAVEDDIRNAEMSLAQGDMTTAHSIADKLSDGENLSGLSAQQLARLSIVYMQLADAEENNDLAANAADCYRRACKISNDSVEEYCRSLTSERAQAAELLRHIVSAADATYSFSDSVPHSDSISEFSMLD